MKEKKVICWKISCVDRSQTQWEYVVVNHGKNGEHKEKVPAKKRFDRHLYLCSSDLSEEDRIYLDVALKYKDVIGNDSLFLNLRYLFREGCGAKIRDATCWKAMFIPDYFEDETGHVLNGEQFMEAVLDLPPQVRTKSGLYVPATMNEGIARAMGYAEIVPLRQEDFELSDENFLSLNNFVQKCLYLRNSPFCTENPPFRLDIVSGKVKFNQSISETRFKSSLMDFRKIYAPKEPDNFTNAVGLLCDVRFIHHPVYKYMSEFKREFSHKKNQKITKNNLFNHFFQIHGEYIPTYENIIDVMFNTIYFHQGKKNTLISRDRLFDALPDENLRLAAFYCALYDISLVFINAGSQVKGILAGLGKLSVKYPAFELSEKEQKFCVDLVKFRDRLAYVISRENGNNDIDPSYFIPEAQKRLKNKFGFPDKYFL